MQWRTNLSFSPARYTKDSSEQDLRDEESRGFALYTSTSRQRKSLEYCFQQSPGWDSNLSVGENEHNLNSSIPRSNSSNSKFFTDERGSGTAISQSFRSLLSLTESTAPWETSSKQPFSSYPRVFCNPVSSDWEKPETDHPQENSSTNPDSTSIMSTRNNQGSPVEEASPNPSNSNEMLVDVERSNDTEVRIPRLEPGSSAHERCGVCKKLLSQKSPWCSYKILRSGDLPAASVFPCHHIYHAECLEKVIPTAQTRDPICPVCSNSIGTTEQQLIMPETLQMALRSLRRSRTAVESEPLNSSCNENQTRPIRRRSKKWEKLSCCLNISF